MLAYAFGLLDATGVDVDDFEARLPRAGASARLARAHYRFGLSRGTWPRVAPGQVPRAGVMTSTTIEPSTWPRASPPAGRVVPDSADRWSPKVAPGQVLGLPLLKYAFGLLGAPA